ncbi:uncharacterized protein METZ01_LOCUS43904, partial [marine metagenome]
AAEYNRALSSDSNIGSFKDAPLSMAENSDYAQIRVKIRYAMLRSARWSNTPRCFLVVH